MYKKLIAMILACTMLVSISPAVAAENTPAKPTVEEILSEFHKAAFEAQSANEADAATTYSQRSSSGSKTLEQQTVDALNAAGYEAYNVTSTNYEALESQLNTDFADMGLVPDGSYIITIHDENFDNNIANGVNPDVTIDLPDEDSGGNGTFTYTYNGTTYAMRYLTVTSRDDPDYAMASSYDLLRGYSDSFLDRLLDAGLTAYLDYINKYAHFGTLLSILGLSDYVNRYRTSNSVLNYYATTNWTRSYVQVWSSRYEYWYNGSRAEYVDMESKISGYVFDSSLGNYIDIDDKKVNKTEYSTNYFNYEQRKIDAARGYIHITTIYDVIGSVRYIHDNTTVAYHTLNAI